MITHTCPRCRRALGAWANGGPPVITIHCPRCLATLPVDQGWHLHQCPDPTDDDTDEWEPEETEEGDE